MKKIFFFDFDFEFLCFALQRFIFQLKKRRGSESDENFTNYTLDCYLPAMLLCYELNCRQNY